MSSGQLRGFFVACWHLLRHDPRVSLILLCRLGILWFGSRCGRLRKLVLLFLPASYEEVCGEAGNGYGSQNSNNDTRYCTFRNGRNAIISVTCGMWGVCRLR